MKHILTLTLLIFLAISIYGQDSIDCKKSLKKLYDQERSHAFEDSNNCNQCNDKESIIYDFKCKSLWQWDCNSKNYTLVNNLRKIKPRYNHLIKFKIININRYLYDVEFTADDMTFESSPPPLFKNLFLGDGSFLDALAGSLSLLKENAIDSSKIKFLNKATPKLVADSTITKFENALKKFKENYNKLIDAQLKAYSYCDKLKCCEERDAVFKFSDFSNSILELKIQYVELQSHFNKAVKDKGNLEKQIKELEEELNQCNNKDEKIEELRKLLKNSTSEVEKKKIQKQIDDLKTCDSKVINEKKKSLEVKLEEIEKIIAVNEDLKKLQATIDNITDDQLQKLILFDNNMVADHNMFISTPIFPQGEILELNIQIKPAKNLENRQNIMPLYSDDLQLKLPVTWKPTINFSSGIFKGIGNNLRSDNYEWQQIPNDTNYVLDTAYYNLTSTGKEMVPIGFAALVTAGTKISPNVGFGLSMGAGISIEKNPRPVYLAGITANFGALKQFSLTYGMSWTQVDRIKKELYKNNSIYISKPSDPEYKKVLAQGMFLSLTYNLFSLTNGKKSKTKSNLSEEKASDNAEKAKPDDTKKEKEDESKKDGEKK